MEEKSQPIIALEDDNLTCRMTVPSRFDRAQLKQPYCEQVLRNAGVEINAPTQQLLKKFIEKVHASPVGDVSGVVAKGTKPTDGDDGWLEWTLEDKAAPSTGDPDEEPVCFYDQSIYTVVKANQVLGRLHPPTAGEDGRDVKGCSLPACEGRQAAFEYDEETLWVDKKQHIIAAIDGVLDQSGTKVTVRDTIEVNQYVDFHTGNIKFDGNVLVHKGVRDRFVVEATGDIEIRGLIEAASIIAGGQLRAKGGFAGREAGSAQTQGDLQARYLDAVACGVRGNLCVDREALNCDIMVHGQIKSPHCSLIGGKTKVIGGVEVGELGSKGHALTSIEIGLLPQLDPHIAELAALTSKLKRRHKALTEEKEALEAAAKNDPDAADKNSIAKLAFEINELKQHLNRALPMLKLVRDKARQLRVVDVLVHSRVHPNTVIVCGQTAYRVQDEIKGPLRLCLDRNDKLVVERSGRKATPLAQQAELSSAA